MGKKGSWFSAIKRVFTHSSKGKVADGSEKKNSKEKKKKGVEKLKQGDGLSFIPLFREPSSIEKILGEAERDNQLKTHRPITPPPEQPQAPSHVIPPPPRPRSASLPRAPTPPRETSPPLQRVTSPPQASTSRNAATPVKAPSPRFVQHRRPEPTLKDRDVCATKIQAAYRGYMGRRSYRTLKGLVRLQGVVKGQSVKRQTASALRHMQLLVRLQTQIQSRRIEMFENQALHRQAALCKNDKDLETTFGLWNLEEWDDSTMTKEERDARRQRKVDASIKRERAMAYAYSHRLWKATPGMAQAALTDIRSGGFPYWWNWLEQRQQPPMTPTPTNPSQSPATRNFHSTPTRPTMGSTASPLGLRFDNLDTPTPRSTKSAIPTRTKLTRTPPGRLQHKFANSPFNRAIFKDDDSLMSCPPFSVPHYMVPTVSAKAKARGGNEQFPCSPSSTIDESKRRKSFPLSPGIGSFKWNKGSLFSNKGSSSQSVLGRKQSLPVDNMSVDSTVSMPATVGRKPFNRFV